MKILITGASGYIGTNLVKSLLADDLIKIVTITRSSFDLSAPNYSNIKCDLANPDFDSILPPSIDVVIHLAQSKKYRNFPDDARDVFDINVMATQRLLEWAKKNGVKKFIFASTGNVYKSQNKLLNEIDECSPIGFYGATKYAAEQLVNSYSIFFSTCIFRIFGVYGPGQQNMTVVNILNKVKNNEEVTLAQGEGLSFSPLYIDDCVGMIKEVVYRENKCKIYNLGGVQPITILHLTKLAERAFNTKSILKQTNDELLYLKCDSSLFCSEYNFKHKATLEKGIEKIING